MAKRMNYSNLANNLPDAFRKDADSNNYKILKINSNTHEGHYSTLTNLFDALNINNDIVCGKVLDELYGSRVNLARGSLEDGQYKIRLKGKMMKNIVDGSFNMLANALAYILQCDASDIHICENGDGTVSVLEGIPLDALYNAGFDATELISLIEEMLPITVTVRDYSFTGTFEFDSKEDTYDEDTGFADDDEAIGGYLGTYEYYGG